MSSMMTPEQVQSYAKGLPPNFYDSAPTPTPAPVPNMSVAPVAPVAVSNLPPASSVAPPDGSQEPVPVTNAVPGQRVQTVDAFHVAPLAIGAHDILNHGEQAAETVLGDVKTAGDEAKQAYTDAAKVQGDIAKAQQPIEDAHEDALASDEYDALQRQADTEDATQKHFDTLINFNKEIEAHVANQPTDLWGRAGVNKVAGIIGLVLGGLGGGATGGKNLVVDTLNQLVEQNLRQNEYKYEMLKGKVTTENQAYAQVRQQFQDKEEAAKMYRLISLNSYQAQLNAAAKQFAGPAAKAAADQQNAQLDMEKAKITQGVYSDLSKSYHTAAEIDVQRRQQNLQSVQLQAAEKAAGAKALDEQSVPYWDPTDKSHMTSGDATKLRDQQGGAAQVQDILSAMIIDAEAGGVEGVLANKQGRANLQIALIQQKSLSKRVTEAEANAMAAMTGFLATGKVADLLTAMGSNSVPEALGKARQQFAAQHVTNLQVGYGLKPTADNPFVKAATAKFTFSTPGQPAGDSPLAQYKGPQERAKEAAIQAQQRRYQSMPRGYGAM